MKADKEKLIEILNNISTLLKIKGENPFKARAYSNAADILQCDDIDLETAVADGTLGEISGIGDALQKKITEFVHTGHISYYDKLIKEIPESLIEITKVSTIGPKKAKLLYDKLGVTNLNDLEKVCLNGEIDKLKGFTPKNKEIILNSIHHKMASRGKFLYDVVDFEAATVKELLQGFISVKNVELTGDLRRFTETPELIEFVLVPVSKDDFIDELNKEFTIRLQGDTLEFLSNNNFLVRIYLAESNNFGNVLHETTGSRLYLQSESDYIAKNGIGIDGKKFSDEKDLYDFLNLQYIEPELREEGEVIKLAKARKLPALVDVADMRGMIHVHTTWSDGHNDIEEMALEARELGYEYIAITDHSQSAFYANGLSVDDVYRQHEEIDKLNEKGLGIKILKGIESDILPDGSLDYPENVLEQFDLIVASVHSSFNMKKEEMTKRIKYALMSPYTTILGHPTGRLLLTRPAYELDIEEIIDCAAEQNKVIEINCNPYRLDLSWKNVIYAKSKNLKLAINPDSHNKETMTDVEIGIKVARKGGLEAKDVINTMSYEQFLSFLNRK